MKKILLILMLSVSLMSYGQPLNTDKLENKNGEIAGEGSYIYGLKTGEWVLYYENGQIKAKSKLKDFDEGKVDNDYGKLAISAGYKLNL